MFQNLTVSLFNAEKRLRSTVQKYLIFHFPVLYNQMEKPIWASNTNGQYRCYLVIQNDGNLVIYNFYEILVWASNTCQIGTRSKILFHLILDVKVWLKFFIQLYLKQTNRENHGIKYHKGSEKPRLSP